MRNTFLIGAIALALAACQNTPPTASASESAPTPNPTAPNLQDPNVPVPNLVQGVCGDCHGVQSPFLSPNPDAPSFEAIANSAGLTGESLTAWLIDAHNYPEFMEFELNEPEARIVAHYMVTLQRDDYEPAP